MCNVMFLLNDNYSFIYNSNHKYNLKQMITEKFRKKTMYEISIIGIF